MIPAMTPDRLASIHASAFGATRAWSAQEFNALLASNACFLEILPDSFALGRIAGPEAELLTLAVSPLSQRQGKGRALLEMFENTAHAGGAKEAFLEVAEDNTAAINLYLSNDYQKIGRRKNYYATKDGQAIDALVLGKSLLF